MKRFFSILRHLLRGCGAFGPGEGEEKFLGPWLRCKDFGPGAKNHCAAVAAANALLLLQGEQIPREALCRRAYGAIGPGPILRPRQLERFLRQEDTSLSLLPQRDLLALQAALEVGRPAFLLLALRPWSWHWVLVRSCRLEKGRLSLEIADGWNAASRCYHPDPAAPWLGAWALGSAPKR